MRVRLGLRLLVLAVMAAVFAPGGAVRAQSDQWNALYDRIIRLEHEVKSLRASGGALAARSGGNASERRLRALEAEVNDLRRQMNARLSRMDARLRKLERARARGAMRPLPAAPRGRAVARRAPAAPRPGLDAPAGPELSVELDAPDNEQVLGHLRTDGAGNPGPVRPAPAPATPAYPPLSGGARPLPGAPGLDVGNGDLPPLAPGAVQAAPLDAPGSGAGTAAADIGADALLKRARDNFLARRFGLAQASYRTFLSRYPRHAKAAEAQFELGETHYVQGHYKDAGKAYVETYRKWPRSKVAPQALLRLGMSLKRLGQGKQACRAWKLLKSRYPSSAAARKGARREMKRARCRG